MSNNLQIGAGAIVMALWAAGTQAQDPNVYDLTWNGTETSAVEECVDEDLFCLQMPINGSIGVVLGSESPRLVNINSDILLPPQVPGSRPVISPNLWNNFDSLVGEYLPTDEEAEVSMVFRPVEVGGVLRAYELFADLTDDGQFLSLTGGIEQSAASPLEPDVRFFVSGRLVTDNLLENPGIVLPEPAVLTMLMLAGVVVISSRCR